MLKIALFLALALGIQSTAADCAMGYMEIPSGNCYLFADQQIKSRSEASSVCAMYNGQLASFETDQEFKEIVSILKQLNPAMQGFVNSAMFDESRQIWQWQDGEDYSLNKQPKLFPGQLRSGSISQEAIVNSDTIVISIMNRVEWGSDRALYVMDLSMIDNIGALCEIEN